MHAEAYAWVADWAKQAKPGSAVLDIGARNINGTVRSLFPAADPYRTLDIVPGDGVDIVADAAGWVPDRQYDVVLCCEVFEHAPRWPEICATALKGLVPGGLLVATMAGTGRPEHSAVDGGRLRPGEYYGGIEADELRDVLLQLGFVDGVMDVRPSLDDPVDVRCAVWRAVSDGVG